MAAITAFIGAGLQALLGDFPLRALLWDQSWFTWWAQLLGFTWSEWVTSLSVDQTIDWLGKLFGGLLLVGGLILVFRTKKYRLAIRMLLIGSVLVLLLRNFLIWKEHFWQIGQLLEMFILTGAPIIYLTRTAWSAGSKDLFPIVLRLLIACTFIGHGLYAVGFHPVPANFVFMTQSGLGVGEDLARQLLKVVGILDFVAAALLVLPSRRAWLTALVWIIPWAVLTTFARVWSYGGYVGAHTLISQWIPEVVVRLPHILLPLALFFLARTQDVDTVGGKDKANAISTACD
ncbi:hypothetical protein FUA23_01005 [Neolewinella aurantiaca]|uniref:Uncharacterized protein n=1 Tax=Neolewinella aurantiaca TaxID=2602767 RepID=A0A5C7FNJ0_9BACT|nr:hypothetical protein [Neolewinella aurantiaca]TXF91795.1 hypothetical protein FUA23_01005 [Neolewinella aurantiaca]